MHFWRRPFQSAFVGEIDDRGLPTMVVVNQRLLFQLGTPVHQLHHGSQQRLLNDDMLLWVVMIGTMKKCS
jgi:hypothetical protein